VLSYPQAVDCLFDAQTNLTVAVRPPRLAVAAGRLWQHLNTYRMSDSPDPLPPT